jgi:hypothetical protein
LFLAKGEIPLGKTLKIFLKTTALLKKLKTRLFFSKGEFPSGKTRKISYVRMPPVNNDLFLCLYMSDL